MRGIESDTESEIDSPAPVPSSLRSDPVQGISNDTIPPEIQNPESGAFVQVAIADAAACEVHSNRGVPSLGELCAVVVATLSHLLSANISAEVAESSITETLSTTPCIPAAAWLEHLEIGMCLRRLPPRVELLRSLICAGLPVSGNAIVEIAHIPGTLSEQRALQQLASELLKSGTASLPESWYDDTLELPPGTHLSWWEWSCSLWDVAPVESSTLVGEVVCREIEGVSLEWIIDRPASFPLKHWSWSWLENPKVSSERKIHALETLKRGVKLHEWPHALRDAIIGYDHRVVEYLHDLGVRLTDATRLNAMLALRQICRLSCYLVDFELDADGSRRVSRTCRIVAERMSRDMYLCRNSLSDLRRYDARLRSLHNFNMSAIARFEQYRAELQRDAATAKSKAAKNDAVSVK
jgi:hypothetical protein